MGARRKGLCADFEKPIPGCYEQRRNVEKLMQKRIDEVVSGLFKRGYTAAGIAYVLCLLAEEHAPGSPEHEAYMVARAEYLEA